MILIGGIPAGPELLIILLFSLVLTPLIAYWVYKDAEERGSNQPFFWGAGVGMLTLIFYPSESPL